MTQQLKHPVTIDEVHAGVFFVQGPASNWTILANDLEVTLIDTGYPRDIDHVVTSLDLVASGKPVRNILITHGHSDHIGGVSQLVATYGSTVWAAREEIPNIRREVLHQVGFKDLIPKILIPRYLRWVIHALKAGGLKEIKIFSVDALRTDMPVQFAGITVIPRVSFGHTPGHLAFDLPEAGAIITGDALITGHATSTVEGLQELSPIWHWSPTAAHLAAMELLTATTRIVLPGHGPAHRP